MTRICATIFNDPGCPWGYSANPALRVLEWRYGAQLDWRLVLIGLAETPQLYLDRGYTPLAMAQGWIGFRRFGMPFTPEAKARIAATSLACRAVVAARIALPGCEHRVLRALQFAQFTSSVLLDEPDDLRGVLATVEGIDADAIVGALDSPDVLEAYARDRAETRQAAGTPGALQGKTANSDGLERYTAPSVIFEVDGQRLEAAGMQPVEAYDVIVANLDPTIERRAAPSSDADGVQAVLAAFPEGLVTGEVAAILTSGNDVVDRDGAERLLVELVAHGAAARTPIGDGALWRPTA
ncbi:MAG: DsbA family protein [Thermoleophilia bacterium]|nr:DsbA family protein [Thermoleophilia bacterium]